MEKEADKAIGKLLNIESKVSKQPLSNTDKVNYWNNLCRVADYLHESQVDTEGIIQFIQYLKAKKKLGQ